MHQPLGNIKKIQPLRKYNKKRVDTFFKATLVIMCSWESVFNFLSRDKLNVDLILNLDNYEQPRIRTTQRKST